MSERPADLLKRAIDVHARFARGELVGNARAVLAQHEELREFLAPMLEPPAEDADRRDDNDRDAGEERRGRQEPEDWPETDDPERSESRAAGTVLGDFELVRELGRGGMGVVFEAVQRSLGRRVALKLLPTHCAASPRALARLRREAALAAGLDHAGIARVIALDEVDGQLHLAMELVDGVPLDRVIARLRGRDPATLGGADWFAAAFAGAGTVANAAPPATASPSVPPAAGHGRVRWLPLVVDLARQVAEALDHAHHRGVVHRDVKPGNVLVTRSGAAVLTDFGLARDEVTPGITLSGEFAGTYHYAPPEQLAGRLDAIDGRSDVFSLGVTLYELLTLRRPFDADSITELQRRIEREEPIDPRRFNHRIGRDLAAVVGRALEKEPSRRYATAGEFAADLRRCARGAPVLARPVPGVVRLARWARRNPLASGFVGVLLAAIVSVSALAAHAAGSARQAAQSLDQFDSLRLGALLAAMERRAELAHPAWPATTAELADLVSIADTELVPGIARHEQRLAVLRQACAPQVGSASGSAPDRSEHPGRARMLALEETHRRLAEEMDSTELPPATREDTERELRLIQTEIAGLRREVDEYDRIDLAGPRERFLHDEIARQLFALRHFARDVLPDLRARLEWSRQVQALTVERQAQAWEETAARVAQRVDYAGTVLAPQLDLIPLGPDPSTGLEEFAHVPSGEVPTRGPDRQLRLGVEHGIVFVLLPRARVAFDWASGNGEVDLEAFFLAKHELGRAQWERLGHGVAGLRLRDGGIFDLRNSTEPWKPANGVTWHMCDRLLARHGLVLPTEAQWAYAFARGGGVPAGLAALARGANLADLAYGRERGRTDVLPVDDGCSGLASIHALEPNALGLHAMLGNVSEWCRDAWSATPRLDPGDGAAVAAAWPGAPRGLRGGSFLEANLERAASRKDRAVPGTAAREAGVRPARRLYPHDPTAVPR